MAYVAPNTVLALSTLSAATWNQDVVANVIDIESRLPTGAVQLYAGASAPSNWLLCNGAETLISGYAALYAVCSTTYGSLTNGSGGVGTTHFRLPDLRGRVPIGAGAGTGLTVRTIGATTGVETHPLSTAELASHTHTGPNHVHTGTVDSAGNHSHDAAADQGFLGGYNGEGSAYIVTGGAGWGIFSNTADAGAHQHTFTTGYAGTGATGSEGNGTAHNNIQPSLALTYIIKT